MPLVFMFKPHLVLINMSVYQWLSIFVPYYLLIQVTLIWTMWRAGIRSGGAFRDDGDDGGGTQKGMTLSRGMFS